MTYEPITQVLIDTVGGETRHAFLSDGRLTALYVDRGKAAVGDLHWARVTARLPEHEAVVVALAGGADGFLPFAACSETVPREGDSVLVQVNRAAFGTKGPRVTGRPTLEGIGLVFAPYNPEIRIGRKLLTGAQRDACQALLRSLVPGDLPRAGFTLRTKGAAMTDDVIAEEAAQLVQRWRRLSTNPPDRLPACTVRAPLEGDRALANLPDEALEWIAVDGAIAPVKARLAELSPGLLTRLDAWRGATPLFEQEGVEEQIEVALADEVRLVGGGRVTIQQTEALVAIDVDTADQVAITDPAHRRRAVNGAAAEECARQIRLRNLSGLVMVDVLKPGTAEEKAELIEQWRAALAGEPDTVVHGLTKGGVLEIVRRRRGVALHELYLTGDRRSVPSPAASAFQAARELLRRTRREPSVRWRLTVSAAIAAAFQGEARAAWTAMADGLGAMPRLIVQPNAPDEQFDLEPMT